MAKRTDIKKILIIGSGPIVIGQAAEFDYAGTQACLALKEEGYEVVLCNSNPATIMTDTIIADKVYMEPLTLEYVAKILRYERPDAIVPGIGGQTGLNLAMQLEKKGILKECNVKLLGISSESIERAEDREMFKELCESIGEPVIPSVITYSLEEAKAELDEVKTDAQLTEEEEAEAAVALAQAKEDAKAILENYLKVYSATDDKDIWFSKIKDLCEPLGFTPNVKEFKKNPELFKGHVGDVSTVIRLAVTSRKNTPDLCSIMSLLGQDKVNERINKVISTL